MIARKFVPLRDFSSCEFTPLKESKCKILHPRRSCITPLNVPYSVFWHAYHRKFTADYAFGARFQAANRAISAPSASRQQSRLRRRCSASTAVNLWLFRAFRPLAGFHSSGLNSVFASRQKHPIAIGTTKVISAPLFSCSGARGYIFEGHKKPRRPERHIGTRCGTAHVPDRRCLGSSMLPLSRLVDGVTVVNASLSATHLGLYGIRR